jgi:hypothetical protein
MYHFELTPKSYEINYYECFSSGSHCYKVVLMDRAPLHQLKVKLPLDINKRKNIEDEFSLFIEKV